MRKCCRLAIVWLSCLLLSAGIVRAADDPFGDTFEKTPEQLRAEMSSSSLLLEAGRLLQQQSFAAAVPYLTDYLERMKELASKDRRVRALMQNVRLKLGQIMVYQKDYAASVKYYEQYLENTPVYRPREALKSLAISYFENHEYEKCITAATNALTAPAVVEEEEETVNFEKMSEEERGGMSVRQLKRYQKKEAEEMRDEIASALTPEKRKEEPEYSLQDKVLLNMALAESYSALSRWEESVEPFRFVIEFSEQTDRCGFAIMKLVRSLSELERYEEVQELVVDLSKSEIRYDIRVNMAMMNAATALFNAGQYDSALMIYRMILPRSVLVDYQLEKVNEMREVAGLPFMEVRVVTNELGRMETVMGYAYGESSIGADASADGKVLEMPEMPEGLAEMENALGALISLRPYEDDVIYRMGQLYLECGRPWEALGSLDLIVARTEEDDPRMKQAFCSALQVMVDPLALYDRVEKRAVPFLEKYKDGVAPRQAAYYLTMAYQRQEQYAKIKTLRPHMLEFSVAATPLETQYDCELHYMQAIADLMLLEYKAAQAGFGKVLADYPKSHQEENLRYWYAMTHLFTQDYEKALQLFEEYLKTYPEGEWIDSVWFQSGVCLFALDNIEIAKQRFTYVIDTFPDSVVYPDACSMRGDICASEEYDGNFRDAIRDYREAIRTAKRPNQAKYAVFQMAGVFDVQERYDEIITLVNSYLERYGEEADVATAAYWIGKTKMTQGLVDEAIAAYMSTIIDYGSDTKQDGVDLIIGEVINVARGLEDEELASLNAAVEAALEAAESVTLQLRLRAMLAEMDGVTIELGQRLITELDDLSQAPPPVLSVICDASFANEDYSRAEDILDMFRKYYEDSDFMRSAFKLRVYDLFEKDQVEEAMQIVMEAQDLYGIDTDTAWVQLMKGRVLMHAGDLDAARETFKMVLGVRFWRGVAYAEATYRLGEIAETEGDFKEAFAWYQRTYFLYKGLGGGTWAAEGYLASARCLEKLGRMGDMRNTYRAMLYDKYVNTLPQADVARQVLGANEVLEIQQKIAAGLQTNLVVSLESVRPEASAGSEESSGSEASAGSEESE